MRTAVDADGRRYVILKESGESTLVADPNSGDRRYLPNERLDVVDDESVEPAEALLARIAEDGPVRVRQILETTTLCESDLHGLLANLEAGGAIREVEVDGERGYELADQS